MISPECGGASNAEQPARQTVGAAALRTLDEVWEAGALAGAAMPPLTQAQADRVAAILAPWRRKLAS
jgi:hypothetical protein